MPLVKGQLVEEDIVVQLQEDEHMASKRSR